MARDDYDDRPVPREESKRVTAGALAIVFFLVLAIPVHKFVLGYTTTGIIQLVLNYVTCGLFAFVQLVEGIIYLTKSDAEFVRTYQVGEKKWF